MGTGLLEVICWGKMVSSGLMAVEIVEVYLRGSVKGGEVCIWCRR